MLGLLRVYAKENCVFTMADLWVHRDMYDLCYHCKRFFLFDFFVNSKPLHRYQHCLLGKARERINTYWVCEDSNFLKVRCASGTFSTILHKGFSRVAFITSREKHFKGAIFSCDQKSCTILEAIFLFIKSKEFFIVLLSVVLTKTPQL